MRAEPLPLPQARSSRFTHRSFRRAFVAACVAAVVAAIATQFLPKYYRAEAKILPASGSGSNSALLDFAASSGVADLLGRSLPATENPSFTYPEILSSRLILERVLLLPYPNHGRPISTVLEELKVKGKTQRAKLYEGVKELREMISVSANPKSGLIAVAVVSRDSVFSAFLANGLFAELNRFNVESRSSRGRASRLFVEGRVQEARRDLAAAESGLASFRAANIRIGTSPQLLLEQSRLERRVDMQADIYRLLARQYELARIEEQRDTPTFSVIDPAKPPVRKYFPSTWINAGVAACIVAIFALGIEYLSLLGLGFSWNEGRRGRG